MIRAGMGPYPHRVALAPRTPGWAFHTVRAVSTGGATAFVLGLLELSLHGRSSNPGMGPYPHRMTVALRPPGCWGIHTGGGAVSTRGATVFVQGLLEVYMYGSISGLGMGYYHPLVALDL